MLVVRCSGGRGAQRLLDAVRADQDGDPSAVEGATTFLVDGEPTARAGVFRRGVHLYQVTLLGEPGAVTQDELDRVLRAQVEHARPTG